MSLLSFSFNAVVEPLTAWRRTGLLACCAAALLGLAACGPREPLARLTHATQVRLKQFRSPAVILVEQGDVQDAHAYYARIKGLVGFDPETSTLDSLLTHFGYAALSADQIEFGVPQDLMTQAPGSLVSRFFAPKIVDFNSPQAPDSDVDNFVPGWRKVVMLPAQPGSAADKAGLASAYLLFNYFQPKLSQDPFAKESGNNQVMLIPKSFTPQTSDAAYWLVYGPKSSGYKIGYALNAAFDVPDHPGGSTKHDYYVPTACAQCHGHDEEYGAEEKGAFTYAKLNYLDTDQWYDMASFDFPKIATSGTLDVLADGGRDHAAVQYKAAVDIIRRLNTQIRDQTRGALREDGSDDFKVAAADTWLSLHAGNDQPQPPAARALKTGVSWDAQTPDDQALLQGLDRYCFRCHGSMYYDVFDKAAVIKKKKSMANRINSGSMPQGRTLDAQDRAALVVLLNKLP